MPDEHTGRKHEFCAPSELHQLYAMCEQLPERLYQIQIDDIKKGDNQ